MCCVILYWDAQKLAGIREAISQLRYEKTALEYALTNCRTKACDCALENPNIYKERFRYLAEPDISTYTDEVERRLGALDGMTHEQEAIQEPVTDTPDNNNDSDGAAYLKPPPNEYEQCDVGAYAAEFGISNALIILEDTFCEKDHIIRRLMSDFHKRKREKDEELARAAKLIQKANEERQKKRQKYNKNQEKYGWRKVTDDVHDENMRGKHSHRRHDD